MTRHSVVRRNKTVMNSCLEWFTFIGAVLGVVATALIIIFQFPKLLDKARSFFRWLWEMGTMLIGWHWWKQYRPDWRIITVGQARITRPDDMFHIELPIEVGYTGKDPRFSTRMDCTSILLDMYNKGKGRDSKPYRLHSKLELQVWNLPYMAIERKQYNFFREEEGLPLVGDSTSCRIIAIGRATIKNTGKPRALKKSHKFRVKVLWELSSE